MTFDKQSNASRTAVESRSNRCYNGNNVGVLTVQAIRSSRPLRAVDKYRVRRRHPPPSTIWDGEQTIYCIRATCRLALKQLYNVTKYPSVAAKRRLAAETGLTMTQVRAMVQLRLDCAHFLGHSSTTTLPHVLTKCTAPHCLGVLLPPKKERENM